MKNNECQIHIISDTGFDQIYYKENDNWIQITNGIERKMTAEQLLSHILPLLSIEYNGNFKIKVIPNGKSS